MKLTNTVYDPFTQKLALKEGRSPEHLLAAIALVGNKPKITAVAGTELVCTLSSVTYTRAAGYWVEVEVTLTTAPTTPFTVGETVTESVTGSATGVVDPRSAGTQLILHTVAVAAFVGGATAVFTGGSSGVVATGGTVVTTVVNLSGKLCWGFISGTKTTGVLGQVVSNTATTVVLDRATLSGGTAILFFNDDIDFMLALTFDVGDIPGSVTGKLITAATATLVLGDFTSAHLMVIIDTASNTIDVTLPDARVLEDTQQIIFIGQDVTTQAFTFLAAIAAQTLDGVDISAGGTAFATIDADNDYIIIEKTSADVWKIAESGIA